MGIAITKDREIAFCRKQHLTMDNGRFLQTAAKHEVPVVLLMKRSVAWKGARIGGE